MKRFISNHADKITGILNGFDRLVFRGTLRHICYIEGLKRFLSKQQVLLKDFGAFAQGLTDRIRKASYQYAKDQGRPLQYLPSSKSDKEAVARKIAQKDKITKGLVAVLSCIEPCVSFDIYRNQDQKRLELVSRLRKGLALYHYQIDPVFGFMNARIQTWMPFNIQICINGREWLAGQMDRTGLDYCRRDNCFVALEDIDKTQKLMDQQLHFAWPAALNKISQRLSPFHQDPMFQDVLMDYYWSVYQSEWATDLMFRNSACLADIYPALVVHGITSFSSPDVMRFLGGKVHGAFKGEIISDFKNRPEGIRIKHRVGQNSIKLYDKQGRVLRVETTINNPSGFKVFRPNQDDPHGQRQWLPMRKGIADIRRRAHISQSSNQRYLDALASADTSTPMGRMVDQICRPTLWMDKRVRALRPWSPEDTQLFQAVSRGEFAVNGFRNRDLQHLLFDSPAPSIQDKRRRSARVTRLLRMLRAHGLIKKIHTTHRYTLTTKGHDIIAAILASQRVSVQQLLKIAA